VRPACDIQARRNHWFSQEWDRYSLHVKELRDNDASRIRFTFGHRLTRLIWNGRITAKKKSRRNKAAFPRRGMAWVITKQPMKSSLFKIYAVILRSERILLLWRPAWQNRRLFDCRSSWQNICSKVKQGCRKSDVKIWNINKNFCMERRREAHTQSVRTKGKKILYCGPRIPAACSAIPAKRPKNNKGG
jgi:hypothetical protein